MSGPNPRFPKRVVALAALLVIGCAASAKKMNRLQLGMTKQEVLGAIGTPDSTSSKNYM